MTLENNSVTASLFWERECSIVPRSMLLWKILNFESRKASATSLIDNGSRRSITKDIKFPERFTIASDAVVCKEAILEGEITIGSGTVVHPTAVIRATNGPIIIGENNNIEETSVIENLNENGETLLIGRDNVFEIGSVRCQVGPNTMVTRGCFIGTNCIAVLQEELPENTVIYGKNNSRRVARDPPQNDSPEELIDIADIRQ
ncbi:bacterial transferase hexapeptide repeat protein [Onchocerca flexuosa]|uniref:Dynactin subunit 6 n=1 Tax=Onchocerca flexuosa TaxID=387005 RepID=A0A238BVR5_9BILA|nr:bacterial transferase hexapeptide repeat protein [Onchocerca flexuosa]